MPMAYAYQRVSCGDSLVDLADGMTQNDFKAFNESNRTL